MDKMLVNATGDIIITNDGATIVKEIEIQHPAAKMIAEVAKTQDEQVGDGTTTAVVLAGEFLKSAEELIDENVHPTVIAAGYRTAANKALEYLQGLGIPVSTDDKATLLDIAKTSMSSKGVGEVKEHLAKIAVDAISRIAEKTDGKYTVDMDNIQVVKKEGGAIEDTVLIDGIILEQEPVNPQMPQQVKDAKIALISSGLEIKKTEVEAKIQITSPQQLQAFLAEEENTLKKMVEKIKSAGANVVLCQKGIDDLAQYYLTKEKIYAVRRVKESDMEKLAKATGGNILAKIDEISENDLGHAKIVENRKIADTHMTFVSGAKNAKAVSILIRGGTEHVVSEVDRSLNDALRVVADVFEDEKITPGGGASAIELAMRLRDFSNTISGREQLAVERFANALEVIPRTLAENAGLDPINTIVDLRKEHKNGKNTYGIDVLTGKVEDMKKNRVLEPLRVGMQAISSATEAAIMILRIDDIIASKRTEMPSKPRERPEFGEY
jgi:thermosome